MSSDGEADMEDQDLNPEEKGKKAQITKRNVGNRRKGLDSAMLVEGRNELKGHLAHETHSDAAKQKQEDNDKSKANKGNQHNAHLLLDHDYIDVRTTQSPLQPKGKQIDAKMNYSQDLTNKKHNSHLYHGVFEQNAKSASAPDLSIAGDSQHKGKDDGQYSSQILKEGFFNDCGNGLHNLTQKSIDITQ